MARGAYGIALEGDLAGHAALRDLSAPCASLRIREVPPGPVEEVVAEDLVRLRLVDGAGLEVTRHSQIAFEATLIGGPTRDQDDLIHPYLAPVAALIHRLRGTPSFHGACVSNGARSVALMGERGQGKTTTTVALVERRGLELLTDDLVVLEGRKVVPGPLSMDLRPSGSELIGVGGRVVRGGERVRRLAEGGTEGARLTAVVHLRWGDGCELTPLSVSERLTALGTQLYWPTLAGGKVDLLELAALPHFTLHRPRGIAGLEAACDQLTGLLRAVPA